MKNKILIILMLQFSSICFSQINVTWEDLAKIEYTEKYFPDYGEYFLYPSFSPSVKSLEGKQIAITGYFLDVDPMGKIFILSKGPMSSCFFCGVGGPETAIELQFIAKPNFKTDEIVTIKGILKLNADDVEHFNYILTECKGEQVD